MRDPITQWYRPFPIIAAIAGMSFGVVLIVRVHHNNDVGASIQRQPVAGFLISPVPPVVLVHLNSNRRETLGHSNGSISTSIVYNNHLIDESVGP